MSLLGYTGGGGPAVSRRNPLQGVTTALPRGMIGSSFPELNQPLTHSKSHALGKGNDGTRMVAAVRTKGNPSELDNVKFQRIDAKKIAAAIPEWSTLTTKTLRFFGYFKEAVHEMVEETERVRKVVLLFYLDDDTLQVSEPRLENSGINQGALLKRHRVMKPGSGDEHYGADDLRVGATISFYGKSLLLCDCDAFTREFYEKLGFPQGDEAAYPAESYRAWRDAHETRGPKDPDLRRVMDLDASQRTGGTIHKISGDERETSRSFFNPANTVLRYYGTWQDPSVHGQVHKLTLLFYQVDNTVVISESIVTNSGKDPFKTFLTRRKLPKPTCGTYSSVSIETISQRSDIKAEFYGEKDLGIGQKVSVFGRDLLICDMDESTRRVHRAKGDNEGDLQPLPMPGDDALRASTTSTSSANGSTTSKRKLLTTAPPPYNGFGSEEDSLGSWTNLVLRPPKRDCAKELRDRDKVLRFGVELQSPHPTDKGRSFVLSYFLADNTLQIYEHLAPNSGLVGGKFLNRQRVRVSAPGMPVEYLQPQDLYLGATVEVHSTKFLLKTTDQRTVALMEGHPKVFTTASVQSILTKLRDFMLLRHTQIAEAFRYFDKSHSGQITASELQTVLSEQQLDVSEHEVMTLMRYFDTDGDGVISFHEFVQRMFPSDHSSVLDEDRGIVELTEVEHNTRPYADAQKMLVNKRTAAKAFKLLVDKLVARNLAAQEAFRGMSQNRDHSHLTEDDFRHSVANVFQLQLPPHEVDALVWTFFYDPRTNVKRSRLTLPGFVRVMDSAPTMSSK